MADSITGRCMCGRHVYTIPKPTQMNLCHCMDCRKRAGSMYSAHLFVNTKDIHTSSPNPRRYTLKSDSGNSMERAWCDECGCGIWIKSDKMPDQTFLKAGLFEPGQIPHPTMENWLKNMEPWEKQVEGTKRAAQYN